ncbi:hypothetical protein [Microvirga sp. VF16]|uniref:hypothetical protein n=1 Tax=Microvirga sp. VF16 TaxID=2807101 RepID=UPI00193D42DC|nr:hypothetical protein [Microvirga sp. VF16]QRM35446.1 hypothetical protein JO965_44705 [Microvirga sp. VF16]
MTQNEREVLEQARDAMYCAFGLLPDVTVPSELADDLIETERALRKALNATLALLSAPPATVVSLADARTRRDRREVDSL